MLGTVADERVILFVAISSSDNLRLGVGLGLGLGTVLIAGLTVTSTFRTPAVYFTMGKNKTRVSATLPSVGSTNFHVSVAALVRTGR